MRRARACCLAIVAVAAMPGCGSEDPHTARLPAIHAMPQITVSGVSSGAHQAAQYQVAYSDSVAGAGLVAGGPWGCAAGELERALGPCIDGKGIDLPRLVQLVRTLADSGALPPLAGLQDDRVFLFHGARDTVVDEAVTRAAAAWYREIAPGASLAISSDIPAAHGFVTVDSGAACAELAAPYVNACGYDLAGTMLAHLYGELAPPARRVQPLARFDQREFAAPGLAEEGFWYAPAECLAGARCRVHLFLHGCNQSASQIGDALARQAGFRRWAESNALVVLFPQVRASRAAPVNPLGCWDWWGYSGANYLQQDAGQSGALRAMVQRLQERG